MQRASQPIGDLAQTLRQACRALLFQTDYAFTNNNKHPAAGKYTARPGCHLGVGAREDQLLQPEAARNPAKSPVKRPTAEAQRGRGSAGLCTHALPVSNRGQKFTADGSPLLSTTLGRHAHIYLLIYIYIYIYLYYMFLPSTVECAAPRCCIVLQARSPGSSCQLCITPHLQTHRMGGRKECWQCHACPQKHEMDTKHTSL